MYLFYFISKKYIYMKKKIYKRCRVKRKCAMVSLPVSWSPAQDHLYALDMCGPGKFFLLNIFLKYFKNLRSMCGNSDLLI